MTFYTIKTTVSDEEGELRDDVVVEFETSPAELDVNWPGDINIISVKFEGEDIMNQLHKQSMNELIDTCSQYSYEEERSRYEEEQERWADARREREE